MRKLMTCLAVTTMLYAVPVTSYATEIMPDFASVPTGWVTDRYAPNSFSDVGSYQGRDNVLAIGISSAQGLANRTATGQGYTFYNTQGKQHAITGGAGSTLSADLFIENSWRDASNGNVRTDMWGVLTNGTSITGYPIIGFTNYGGNARLRAWDNFGWHDFSTAVNFGDWTSLTMTFTGNSVDYYVNGVSVYSDSSSFDPTTGFSAVIMQAYNFDDPSISGAVVRDYTANWSNTQPVPEPSTMLLLGGGLVGVAFWRKRKTR